MGSDRTSDRNKIDVGTFLDKSRWISPSLSLSQRRIDSVSSKIQVEQDYFSPVFTVSRIGRGNPCNQLFTRPSLPLSKRSVKRRLASAVWRISNRIKPHDCRTREPLINVASLVKKSPLRQHRSSWSRELEQKLVKTVVSVVVLRFLNPS